MFVLIDIAKQFPNVVVPICNQQAVSGIQVLITSYPCHHVLLSVSFILAILVGDHRLNSSFPEN